MGQTIGTIASAVALCVQLVTGRPECIQQTLEAQQVTMQLSAEQAAQVIDDLVDTVPIIIPIVTKTTSNTRFSILKTALKSVIITVVTSMVVQGAITSGMVDKIHEEVIELKDSVSGGVIKVGATLQKITSQIWQRIASQAMIKPNSSGTASFVDILAKGSGAFYPYYRYKESSGSAGRFVYAANEDKIQATVYGSRQDIYTETGNINNRDKAYLNAANLISKVYFGEVKADSESAASLQIDSSVPMYQTGSYTAGGYQARYFLYDSGSESAMEKYADYLDRLTAGANATSAIYASDLEQGATTRGYWRDNATSMTITPAAALQQNGYHYIITLQPRGARIAKSQFFRGDNWSIYYMYFNNYTGSIQYYDPETAANKTEQVYGLTNTPVDVYYVTENGAEPQLTIYGVEDQKTAEMTFEAEDAGLEYMQATENKEYIYDVNDENVNSWEQLESKIEAEIENTDLIRDYTLQIKDLITGQTVTAENTNSQLFTIQQQLTGDYADSTAAESINEYGQTIENVIDAQASGLNDLFVILDFDNQDPYEDLGPDFLTSANWVKEQIIRLTSSQELSEYNQIGKVTVLSQLLGFIRTILGI